MSYSPEFWGFGAIPKVYWTRYMFESQAENLSFSRFIVVLMSYNPTKELGSNQELQQTKQNQTEN